MATIGFIGSGNIGGTVARLSVPAGYDVAARCCSSTCPPRTRYAALGL
jgi:predicted dinucleotide-binding enzyme